MHADATTPTDLIALVREAAAAVRARETELLVLAAAWADAHPDLEADPVRGVHLNDITDIEQDRDPDGPDPRIPAMAWDAGAPFAAALGVSTGAGESMIRDALVLRHRLPRTWARLMAHELPVWRARRIAQAVLGRPDDVSAHLDEAIAPIAEKVGPGTLDRLGDELMMRLYPEEVEHQRFQDLEARHATLHELSRTPTGVGDMTICADWKDLDDFSGTLSQVAGRLDEEDAEAGRERDSLDVRRARAIGVLADPEAAAALLAGRPAPRPKRRTTLFVHLSQTALEGLEVVGRDETSARPVLAEQVREWCRRTDTHLTVTPVIDLNDHVSVDRYEVGDRLRTRVSLRHPTCVFPWCSRPARNCDVDHALAHASGGSTCDCNLAPLCRRHHRLKTKAGWRYQPVEPGVWLWSEPHGQRFLRDARGTTDVTPARRPEAFPA
jgi:hypothetical protein